MGVEETEEAEEEEEEEEEEEGRGGGGEGHENVTECVSLLCIRLAFAEDAADYRYLLLTAVKTIVSEGFQCRKLENSFPSAFLRPRPPDALFFRPPMSFSPSMKIRTNEKITQERN